jgi:hypothetical protein
MAKTTLSVQLHEANEALTRANATIADLQKKLADSKSGGDYYSKALNESNTEREQIHLLLDALIGVDTRKAVNPNGYGETALPLAVRFSLYLSGKRAVSA